MKRNTRILLTVAALGAVMLAPSLAHAATAAGGGMPYSAGIGVFKSSVIGEVAGIICLIAVVAGVATYLFQGVMDHLMLGIVRVIIGAGIIGSATTALVAFGVTGAIVG
jgi:hypothetical protein